MNFPSIFVLLIVAVAVYLAVRSFLRAGRTGGCSCGSSSCSGCSSSVDCPYCSSGKSSRRRRAD